MAARVQADKGTIDIRNNGAGDIELKNATLRGDVVKANVMGANGQLIIGGGSINADTTLKLYASGSNGSVLFKENVSLNGNSVKTIAGNTVTIENGKVVTVNGPQRGERSHQQRQLHRLRRQWLQDRHLRRQRRDDAAFNTRPTY